MDADDEAVDSERSDSSEDDGPQIHEVLNVQKAEGKPDLEDPQKLAVLSPDMEPVTREQHVYLAYHALRSKILQMWCRFLERDRSNSKSVVKPASFNVNERVFNLVVKNHVDMLEQFECLELYWEHPFGGNVTVRTVSTKF
jgi:hypothetical protein